MLDIRINDLVEEFSNINELYRNLKGPLVSFVKIVYHREDLNDLKMKIFRTKLPPNLLQFTIKGNYYLKIFDCKLPLHLEYLNLSGNSLKKFDIELPARLIKLNLAYNQLTEFNVELHPNLRAINLSNNKLTSFKYKKLPLQLELYLQNNNFKKIKVINTKTSISNVKNYKTVYKFEFYLKPYLVY